MSGEKVITMEQIRAEQCDKEINAVLDKYQCSLVSETRHINGVFAGFKIYSVPVKPKIATGGNGA